MYFYPTFAKRFPNFSGWNYLVEIVQPRMELFDRIITQHQHKDTLRADTPRDFVDAYLMEAGKGRPAAYEW